MPPSLSLPSTWHPANRRRVEEALALSRRNEAIREAYRNRPEGEKGTDAMARIGREYHLSIHAVEMVVNPRG